MVKNNEWVIPKNIDKPVETVYELKGDEYKVPSFEEFMKSYESDGNLNYADLSGGSVGEVKGYGPCDKPDCPHYLDQGYVSLHLSCPATNCISGGKGEAYQWTHENCSGPIYINADANLKCMKEGCGTTGYITNWSFKCSKHPGDYLETTNDDCVNALATVFRLYPNKPAEIKRVIRSISDKLMDGSGYTAGLKK